MGVAYPIVHILTHYQVSQYHDNIYIMNIDKIMQVFRIAKKASP